MKLHWIGIFLAAAALVTAAKPWSQDPEYGLFRIHFDAPAFAELPSGHYSGDVFVAFSQRGEPRGRLRARFQGPPILRFRAEQVKPGGEIVVNINDATAFDPLELTEMGQERWRVQAIVRRNPNTRVPGLGAGDIVSDPLDFYFTADSPEVLDLHLSEVVPERTFQENERAKEFVHQSAVLSAFHGRDYPLKAGVLLPKDYDPEKRYPVVLHLPSFGGDYFPLPRMTQSLPDDSPLQRCLVVVPSPEHRFGHSGFCDSANNGPWARAFVEEFLPALEARFGGAGAQHRYLFGVGSGGWSALWLTIQNPEAFAGCWSHAPDPIDFHDFLQISLYDPIDEETPRNLYRDEAGELRPLARMKGRVRFRIQDFIRREEVLDPGGQFRSWEANFSPQSPQGGPMELFDRETGAIDHQVAQAWRAYDISHLLLTRWESLGPKLKGKLHIYAGGEDTFYYEGAVERFRRLAEPRGILQDIVVQVFDDQPHQQYPEGWEAMLAAIETDLQTLADD